MFNKKILLAASFHLIFAAILYLMLYQFNIITTFPTESNVLNWDAEWFNSIRLGGYEFKAKEICNLAFFPLFPYFWKWTWLNGIGISILNYVIFMFAIAYLLKHKELHYLFLLCVFSTASFIFFALPYSESLFFLFSTLILRGYQENKRLNLIAGFFLASLVRSVAMIFVPAILICTLFSIKLNFNKRVLFTMFYSIMASLSGLFISAFVQYWQTHTWFYFLTVQKMWGREWMSPSFPLTSTYPERTLGLDGVAFVVGIAAIYFCFKYAFFFSKALIRRRQIDFVIEPMVFFSMIFLAGTTLLDTCFTFKIGFSSNIWSINRHILCSPFYIAFLIWLYKNYQPSKLEKIFFSSLIFSGIYLTGVYQYPNLTLYYLLFFFAFYLFKYWPSYSTYLVLFFFFSTLLQLLCYQDFFRHLWIG